MSKINIADLFTGLQNQMIAQLNTNREFITHPGSKGDALENVWIEWLRKYLPNRYCVDKGIVIDYTGEASHQIDIVIYDQQYTPFVLTQNGFNYIPAEGIYAVFEVKPDFEGNAGGSNHIKYAGEKIESVRRLKRTSTGIINAGKPQDARPLTKIVGGILASTNSIKQNDTLEYHLKGLRNLQTLELGCAADTGSFLVNYHGEEDVTETSFEKRIMEYYEKRTIENVSYSTKQNSLVFFFLQLTRYLQQTIGTVAAIDLNEWAKPMGFTIDKAI